MSEKRLWINSGSRHLYTLNERQQFYDVESPFPPEMAARVMEAQKVAVELTEYVEAVYNAIRGRQDWKKVRVPAWLVAEEILVELPVKPDTEAGSRGLLDRLLGKPDTK